MSGQQGQLNSYLITFFVVTLGAALIAYQYNQIKIANQARQFAQQSIQVISAQWDMNALEQLSKSSQFPANNKDRVNTMLKQAKSLGSLKNIKVDSEDFDLHFKIFSDAANSAHFIYLGNFESGEARIIIELIEKSQQWNIADLQVEIISGQAVL